MSLALTENVRKKYESDQNYKTKQNGRCSMAKDFNLNSGAENI